MSSLSFTRLVATGGGDIAYFVYQVTPKDHVFQRSCDFIGGSPL